jgi:hypothetical protein
MFQDFLGASWSLSCNACLKCTEARTTGPQWSLFFVEIQICWAWAENSGRWILGHPICSYESLVRVFHQNLPLKLQKTKPLYPNSKYLFGIGIWMLAAKHLRFSHRVSVVCALEVAVLVGGKKSGLTNISTWEQNTVYYFFSAFVSFNYKSNFYLDKNLLCLLIYQSIQKRNWHHGTGLLSTVVIR